MAGLMNRISGRELERTTFPSAGAARDVTADLAYIRTAIVNLFLWGPRGAGDRGWVLVDTGLPGSGSRIAQAAEERFGAGARPRAIILTHGHFDHRGDIQELAEMWDCVVYAHPMELPYLTGESSYPPPDPTVPGGALARLSFMYPRKPIDLGGRVRALPADGTVPGMPGWRWIHTPGHTAGHVSLYRDADRVLIAGDAFVTTRQEALTYVLEQTPEVNGPPAYYTPDWPSAERSVKLLAALEPEVAATGHGIPLKGAQLRDELRALAAHFRERAIPKHGRYVDQPAVADARGVVSLPPAPFDATKTLLVLGGAFVLGVALAQALRTRRRGETRERTEPRAQFGPHASDGHAHHAHYRNYEEPVIL